MELKATLATDNNLLPYKFCRTLPLSGPVSKTSHPLRDRMSYHLVNVYGRPHTLHTYSKIILFDNLTIRRHSHFQRS